MWERFDEKVLWGGSVQVFSISPGEEESSTFFTPNLVQSWPQSILQHFHHPSRNPTLIGSHSPFPFKHLNPRQLGLKATTNYLSVSTDLLILGISYKWNHVTWYFVTDFFHIA